MAAGMRAKKAIVTKLYTQFKIHGLTTGISYEDYVSAVGSKNAVPLRHIAKGWRGRWTVIMAQLQTSYRDVNEIVNVIEEEEPEPTKPSPMKLVPGVSGLEALKALSAEKED